MKSLARGCCRILGVVAVGGTLWAAPAPHAIVIGDVTPEGKKQPPPTRDAPQYYFPTITDYRELGAVMAGTKSPSKDDVLQAVITALARENYLLVKPGSKPDLALTIWWGSLNPLVDEMEANEGDLAPTQVFFNKREMLALVGAFKADAFFKFDSDQLREAATDDRYFILIAAYDFAALEKKEKKLVWSARMSTESTGRSPEETFPLLAASGAAVFGRNTVPAVLDTSKPIKRPEIKIGPTEVIEVISADKKP